MLSIAVFTLLDALVFVFMPRGDFLTHVVSLSKVALYMLGGPRGVIS